MNVEYLIIGQGISGTFLSYYLQQERKSFLVIDNNDRNAPSRIAAGIINPVTGRRMVTVWMADEILPFAWNAYEAIGNLLGIKGISERPVIDFFPNPFMRENFLKRKDENAQYLYDCSDKPFNSFFNFQFGCGKISPAYTAHLETLLPAWRKYLQQYDHLLEEEFDSGLLRTSDDRIIYKDITAEKIIFCDGPAGVHNPYFEQLPFAPNKGEALIVEIPGLSPHHIYKKSMTLAPLAIKDVFWIGSVYHWEFDHPDPTAAFRKNTEQVLHDWLKIPWKVMDHVAAIRPATLERRPFVGFHPVFKNVGIINGMGTKGCSLAPYFARELCEHLVHGNALTPGADIKRFNGMLSRQTP